MSSVLDPRVVRTRRLLIKALTDLIVLEGIEAVNIRKIVQRAEVNRSTFYLHFRDIQDILTQMQDDILKVLGEKMNNPTYDYELAKNDYKRNKKPIKAMLETFEHIKMNASLYRKMLGDNAFREHVTQMIIKEIYKFRDSIWEATYMANGIVGIICYWLENGMKETTMEMSLWLTKITLFPLGKFDDGRKIVDK